MVNEDIDNMMGSSQPKIDSEVLTIKSDIHIHSEQKESDHKNFTIKYLEAIQNSNKRFDNLNEVSDIVEDELSMRSINSNEELMITNPTDRLDDLGENLSQYSGEGMTLQSNRKKIHGTHQNSLVETTQKMMQKFNKPNEFG